MSIRLGCVGARRRTIVSVICKIVTLPEDEPINGSKHVGVLFELFSV
jgi:hypothetical protein